MKICWATKGFHIHPTSLRADASEAFYHPHDSFALASQEFLNGLTGRRLDLDEPTSTAGELAAQRDTEYHQFSIKKA